MRKENLSTLVARNSAVVRSVAYSPDDYDFLVAFLALYQKFCCIPRDPSLQIIPT